MMSQGHPGMWTTDWLVVAGLLTWQDQMFSLVALLSATLMVVSHYFVPDSRSQTEISGANPVSAI